MAAIPEFVLRKLFVPGSLKPWGAGFIFLLNNTFAPVTLNGLKIFSDGTLVALENIFIAFSNQDEFSAHGINPQRQLNLPKDFVVSVMVGAPLPRKTLRFVADTQEIGELQFSIPVGGRQGAGGLRLGQLRKFLLHIRNLVRIFHVQHDAQHPGLHFAPPANWMNDPNGLICWQGNYHLFYQHNPFEATWGNIHWGHAVSSDMLHWKHLPIALAPDPGGPDEGGCFSGCALDNNGTPTILYTGVFPETQCLAQGCSPGLVKWRKNPDPLIPSPPDGLQVEGFRDPYVWKEGTEWRMVLGSGIRAVGGAVLLYRSLDLLHWDYLGVLFQGDATVRDPFWTGTMWECPSFFPLGSKWVLILSCSAAEGGLYTVYYIGDYRDDRFIPGGPPQLLDLGEGGCFYAPQTFLDENGRRVMFGWLRESRGTAAQVRAGWSGAMSFPRVLSLGSNGQLQSLPLEEINALRKDHECLNEPNRKSSRIKGGFLELCAHIPPEAAAWSGVILTAGGKSDPCVKVGYDVARGVVVVDCSQADGLVSEAPVDLNMHEDLILHIYVDASILEVFADGIQPLSARFYLKKTRRLAVQCLGSVAVELWGLSL